MSAKQSAPVVVAVTPNSAADIAGMQPGDEVRLLNGMIPRDIIEWRLIADEAEVEIDFVRGGIEQHTIVAKKAGEPLGAEVSSALFDRVRTCDNHCAFCFIYQLPPGMRQSLYLKDDDYRLSFLYGNFTTLTRFTEADLERVITEGLSPLNVSIHATDPTVRSEMLRNPRGGMSLRWLRQLLDHDICVNGQIVVCPGVNDGDVLEDSMIGILDRYADLHHVALVPLGISRYNNEATMRAHTQDEARAVVELVERWQKIFLTHVGHRMVFAADEYYLMADMAFPAGEDYEGFGLHEDGIGMARTFEWEFDGRLDLPTGPQSGFFASVDGAPAEGYRAPRNPAGDTGLRGCSSSALGDSTGVALLPRRTAPVGILTAPYGAEVLQPLIDRCGRDDVRVVTVANDFFGGNTAVTGLMVGQDIAKVLSTQPQGHRYLLPDVCLSEGRFLDGLTPQDLPRPVEIVATDGIALRRALEVAR
ncbi:radical SAM protein [Actinomycetes bacterium]|nr:radical SAM protein [Actinomycetes bacterium]